MRAELTVESRLCGSDDWCEHVLVQCESLVIPWVGIPRDALIQGYDRMTVTL